MSFPRVRVALHLLSLQASMHCKISAAFISPISFRQAWPSPNLTLFVLFYAKAFVHVNHCQCLNTGNGLVSCPGFARRYWLVARQQLPFPNGAVCFVFFWYFFQVSISHWKTSTNRLSLYRFQVYVMAFSSASVQLQFGISPASAAPTSWRRMANVTKCFHFPDDPAKAMSSKLRRCAAPTCTSYTVDTHVTLYTVN